MGLPLVFMVVNLVVGMLRVVADDPPYACGKRNGDYLFCDGSKPIRERVEDLIRRLSLEEKVGQLVTTADGIQRLGVPKYEWWSEALHGVAQSGHGIRFDGTVRAATSFPQVILSAASFNVTLWYHIAQVRFHLYLYIYHVYVEEFKYHLYHFNV